MTVGRWLLLLGFACLLIVLFTDVAERLRLFPGLPDGPGHYLDLVSALFGSALLIAGVLISFNRPPIT